MEPIKSFEDLDVWKVGREVRRDLYRLAKQLPKHEQYCLGQQVRTAGVSLTANIAEGYGRFHFKENVQFCRIARGSAYELLDHLITCHDQGYMDEKCHQELRGKLVRFIQLVNGYIRSIGQLGVRKTGCSATNDD
jgi:four helix bundle protein